MLHNGSTKYRKVISINRYISETNLTGRFFVRSINSLETEGTLLNIYGGESSPSLLYLDLHPEAAAGGVLLKKSCS